MQKDYSKGKMQVATKRMKRKKKPNSICSFFLKKIRQELCISTGKQTDNWMPNEQVSAFISHFGQNAGLISTKMTFLTKINYKPL